MKRKHEIQCHENGTCENFEDIQIFSELDPKIKISFQDYLNLKQKKDFSKIWSEKLKNKSSNRESPIPTFLIHEILIEIKKSPFSKLQYLFLTETSTNFHNQNENALRKEMANATESQCSSMKDNYLYSADSENNNLCSTEINEKNLFSTEINNINLYSTEINDKNLYSTEIHDNNICSTQTNTSTEAGSLLQTEKIISPQQKRSFKNSLNSNKLKQMDKFVNNSKYNVISHDSVDQNKKIEFYFSEKEKSRMHTINSNFLWFLQNVPENVDLTRDSNQFRDFSMPTNIFGSKFPVHKNKLFNWYSQREDTHTKFFASNIRNLSYV